MLRFSWEPTYIITEMHILTSSGAFWRGMAASSFAAACLLTMGIDYLVGNVAPLSKMTTYGLHRSEPYLASESYRQLKAAPDVVLIGSSLMLAPVLQSDANRLGQPLDRKRYRKSVVLEELLAQSGLQNCTVFNFAVGGCMFSDAYYIARRVLADKPPSVIIYGIAPRDVQDTNVPGIESTETFRCLAQPDDALAARNLSSATRAGETPFLKRMDLVLGRASSLWRYRADLNPYAQLRIKRLMEKTLPWVAFMKKAPCGAWMEIKGFKFMEEMFDEPVCRPGTELEHKDKVATAEEYRQRYNPLREPVILEQTEYLDKLAALCESKHVQLIVVNMPLSQTNQSLMPSGFYSRFKQETRTICAKHSADYVDWSESPWTQREDHFIDGVHVSSQDSKAFLQDLSKVLTSPRATASLKQRLASSPSGSLQ